MGVEHQKPLYPMGIMAELLDIHPRTIRIYEQEGLIRPVRRGGKRFFSNSDLQWLQCLRKFLREDGLNIASIKKLLKVVPCWKIRGCAEEQRRHCPATAHFPIPCWDLVPHVCEENERSCSECDVRRLGRNHILMQETFAPGDLSGEPALI